MSKNNTGVVVKKPKDVASVESFITKAIETNVPIETMERLFALRKEVKAEQAEEAFDEALSQAQGEFPIVKKTKDGGRTQGGSVAYKYAPIEDIEELVRPVISKYNLSSSFKTEVTVDKVKVTCIAKHKLGHSEFSEMELPLGQKTNIMSAPQAVVATVTFAKRYTFCNVFGITVGGEDTDAKDSDKNKPVAPNKPTNTKSQIMFLLKNLGVDTADKTTIPGEILRLTKLDVNEEDNLNEIKDRLEILVTENKQ